MTSISRFGFARHLRAEPNQFILHYRSGAIVRRGPGLAYWFLPLSAAIVQLPVEDVETTFVLTERTADYQDVSVQSTLTYRVVDPEAAAAGGHGRAGRGGHSRIDGGRPACRSRNQGDGLGASQRAGAAIGLRRRGSPVPVA